MESITKIDVDGLQLNDDELNDLLTKTQLAKKLVFVSGNFNVVHPGHLRLLRFAAECGDFLIVGVNDGSSRGAMLPEDMRLEGVKVISFVSYAFILREPPEQYIAKLHPHIVVKGKEHESSLNPEKEVVEAYGGQLLFGSGEASFSSLDLLHREYIEANYSSIRKPTDYPQRHGFEIQSLKIALRRMVGLKVLVIGDLIVDEYITCDPLGMSQEDPTIVVVPIESKKFVGGAGIVAAHAHGLGADVRYLSVSGVDEMAKYAEKKLAEYGVSSVILQDGSRPTTLKQRYRAAGKTLLRVSQMRQHAISNDLAARLLRQARKAIVDCDLVIFSDFNYGCLPQKLVDEVIALGRKHAVPMVADSQASSQISDVSRFNSMMLLSPTEREARLAMRDSDCGLAVLAEGLANKAQAQNVVITLGPEGLLVLGSESGVWVTDRLPSFNTAPKDSAGAGDSLLTCTSMALCAGLDIWRSVYLGSIVAGCQVARLGNTPLTQQDLAAEIDHF